MVRAIDSSNNGDKIMIRRLRLPIGGEARLSVEEGPVLIEGHGNLYGPWAGVVAAKGDAFVFSPPLAPTNTQPRRPACETIGRIFAPDPLWA